MQSIWISAILLHCQGGGPATAGRVPLGSIWLLISLGSVWNCVTGILCAEHKLGTIVGDSPLLQLCFCSSSVLAKIP